jgi:hypothetical protein
LKSKQKLQKEKISDKPSVEKEINISAKELSFQPLTQPSPSAGKFGDIFVRYIGPNYISHSTLISVDEVKPGKSFSFLIV